MQIIGAIGAIAFLILFRGKKKQHPKNILREVFIETDHGSESVEGFLRRTDEEEQRAELGKESWYREHTDPLFGRPIDVQRDLYFHRARLGLDKSKLLNEYQVPFRFSKTGFVNVFTDEFPLHDQKFIFEWMVERMEEVSVEIYRVLQNSTDDETCSEEELKTAFDPGRITRIKMSGSSPVAWSIRFDTDIGEGEALVGTVLGKDQRIESAEVGYG